MKIETKYNIGQEVYFLFNGKPIPAKILDIESFMEEDIYIFYHIVPIKYPVSLHITEEKIFPPKKNYLKACEHENKIIKKT